MIPVIGKGQQTNMIEPILLDEIKNIINEGISRLGVKSVQRGVVAAAGNISIQTVNPDKAVVLSVSKGSAGTVATNSYINTTVDTNSGIWPGASKGVTLQLTGGTTNLTTKQYSAKLVNATTLSCDGPVEWQVIEYM